VFNVEYKPAAFSSACAQANATGITPILKVRLRGAA
jgi:hypothetical protein